MRTVDDETAGCSEEPAAGDDGRGWSTPHNTHAAPSRAPVLLRLPTLTGPRE
jgi:hypothetical protein